MGSTVMAMHARLAQQVIADSILKMVFTLHVPAGGPCIRAARHAVRGAALAHVPAVAGAGQATEIHLHDDEVLMLRACDGQCVTCPHQRGADVL